MKTFFSSFLLFLLLINTLHPQYTNVRIGYLNRPHETSIMINPFNPNIIVAAANIYTSNSLSGYYYSSNGGSNWSEGILMSNVVMPYGDVVVIVDTSEYFYIIQNSNAPSFNVHLVQKSTDYGVTWSNGVTYGDTSKMQDKPWGCVDLSNSVYRNNIYITWTMFDEYLSYDPNDSSYIMFTRSTDGGQSFSNPFRICEVAGNAIDSSNTVEGAVPCVGPNGEIYVSWSGPLGIVFDRSTDGGLTWLDNDIFVTTQPGGWTYSVPGMMRCNGFPITTCDLSGGQFNGNIYINWSDQRNGSNDTDIWFIKSTDGGNTWCTVKRVNDDPPGKHQFLTWMTVDKVTGYLYFVFYDRRNYTNNFTDVNLARSTDGGESFVNVKISTVPFYAIANLFLGDYNNISAYGNKVRPIWTRVEGSYTSIWTALIDTFNVGIQKTSHVIPEKLQLSQNYPNPFNPITTIDFDIPYSSYVKLKVYNITGKVITTLINKKLKAGSYKAIFSTNEYNLASGVFFYELSNEHQRITKRMLYIK